MDSKVEWLGVKKSMLIVTFVVWEGGEIGLVRSYSWVWLVMPREKPTIGQRGFAPVTKRVLTPPLGGQILQGRCASPRSSPKCWTPITRYMYLYLPSYTVQLRLWTLLLCRPDGYSKRFKVGSIILAIHTIHEYGFRLYQEQNMDVHRDHAGLKYLWPNRLTHFVKWLYMVQILL